MTQPSGSGDGVRGRPGGLLHRDSPSLSPAAMALLDPGLKDFAGTKLRERATANDLSYRRLPDQRGIGRRRPLGAFIRNAKAMIAPKPSPARNAHRLSAPAFCAACSRRMKAAFIT
jgi:hypothetical protein